MPPASSRMVQLSCRILDELPYARHEVHHDPRFVHRRGHRSGNIASHGILLSCRAAFFILRDYVDKKGNGEIKRQKTKTKKGGGGLRHRTRATPLQRDIPPKDATRMPHASTGARYPRHFTLHYITLHHYYTTLRATASHSAYPSGPAASCPSGPAAPGQTTP